MPNRGRVKKLANTLSNVKLHSKAGLGSASQIIALVQAYAHIYGQRQYFGMAGSGSKQNRPFVISRIFSAIYTIPLCGHVVVSDFFQWAAGKMTGDLNKKRDQVFRAGRACWNLK